MRPGLTLCHLGDYLLECYTVLVGYFAALDFGHYFGSVHSDYFVRAHNYCHFVDLCTHQNFLRFSSFSFCLLCPSSFLLYIFSCLLCSSFCPSYFSCFRHPLPCMDP